MILLLFLLRRVKNASRKPDPARMPENLENSMEKFLYLLSTAIKNINAGNSNSISPISVSSPTSPSGSKISATLTKSQYVDLATRVSSYITTNKRAPNYASSSFGNIQFQSLVYELSKVLNFVKTDNRLPNTLAINTNNPSTLNGGNSGNGNSGTHTGGLNEKNTLSSSELEKYLQASANCQVNSETIKNLAASITKNCKTELEKATAIFNYVKNNIAYSYYFDTVRGAIGTYTSKKGNCVDQTHLLIALTRASGLATRYVHADCTFSSGKVGHVFAQILIGDTWTVADVTNSRNSLGSIESWNTDTYTLKGQGKSVSINF